MCLTQWCDMVTGSTLNVCSQYLQDELQCCSQSDEGALGFRFANDITLGIEDFPSLLNQYEDLLIALFGKCYIGLELMINFTKLVRLTPQQLSCSTVAG